MPFYDFQCKDCGEQFSKRISWQEKPGVTCPHCGSQNLREIYGFNAVVKSGGSSSGSSGGCGSGFG